MSAETLDTLKADLTGQIAIVTGAAQGLGQQIAITLAANGAKVACLDMKMEALEDTIKAITDAGGSAEPFECNVTDRQRVDDVVEEIAEKWEKIDILVNNAGIGAMRPVWGTPKRSFEAILAVNLIGTFLCTKHVWRPMRDAGGGSIINVSSMGGLTGYPLLSAYCASKFGQIGFTKACAEEGKRDNIRVNAIAPGKADTALRAQIKENKALMLKPEDHVGICIFLGSTESQYINGQVIPIVWYGPEVKSE